jgi:hypothetical protein
MNQRNRYIQEIENNFLLNNTTTTTSKKKLMSMTKTKQ